MAEAYLNSLEFNDMQVISSGTVAEEYRQSNESHQVYQTTLAVLKSYGIDKFAKDHFGDQVEKDAHILGDVVVCMNQIVYNELLNLTKNLPSFVRIWEIKDYGETSNQTGDHESIVRHQENTFPLIKERIDNLVQELNLS
jgi:protein-tyrosine-phosphatase